MTRQTMKAIVAVMIAVIAVMIMCTAVSQAAAKKKTYRLPVKIKTQDGLVMKITYKGNVVKYSVQGNGMQKFTYKSKNKYNLKSTLYDFRDSATVRTKKGRVVSLKGKNEEGKYTITYKYKKGKPYKYIRNITYNSEAEYKKARTVVSLKADKHGNIKKAIVKRTYTKRNGKLKKESLKDVYTNKYKSGRLKRSSVKYYSKYGKKWSVDYADVWTFTYKKMKLTKKQYNKYKPIMKYIIRDASTLY